MKILRPRAVDKDDPRYIELRSCAVSAVRVPGVNGAADRYLINGTASSSVVDRYGDLLTDICQAGMLGQAAGLTMWLNHSYNVPEDIAGTCVDPKLENAIADDGTACLDLIISLEVDPENPRAFKSWQHVERGTKLAFSIGGYFTKFDIVYEDADDWWGHLIVDEVELLEISLVGIPANPRAYTKTFDALRAHVVKQAEAIALEAREKQVPEPQMRMLVRKSFGLPAEEETIMKTLCTAPDCTTAVKGGGELCDAHRCSQPFCKNARVKDAELCAEHAPAPADPPEPVEPPIVEETPEVVVLAFPDSMPDLARSALLALLPEIAGRTYVVADRKTVEDSSACGQIVEAMKCIKSAIVAPSHAMCAEPTTMCTTAHAMLKAILPDDYGLPEDAQLDAPPVVVADPDAAAQLTAANATIAKLSADLEKTAQELETLKATPTGRSTVRSQPGGSSEGSEATVPVETYYENRSLLAARGARAMDRGSTSDARQSAQVKTD